MASTGTAAGGGQPFIKLIKKQLILGVPGSGANTQFALSLSDIFFGVGKNDGDALAAIPTTGDPVALLRPYAVDVAGLASAPLGVALGTVTSGNRTLIQTAGIAQVLAVGSTDAVVDGLIVVCTATGNVKGSLTTASAASAIADASSIVGYARQAYVSATAKLIAVSLIGLQDRQ